MKRQSNPSIVFADFCKPASIKTEPNPPEHNIAAAYERLRDAMLDELLRLISRWSLRTCEDGSEALICAQQITLTP